MQLSDILVVGGAGLVIGGLAVGLYLVLVRRASLRRSSALIEEARNQAEALRRDAEIRAKEEILRRRDDFEKEMHEARNELRQAEKLLIKREGVLERKLDDVEHQDRRLKEQERKLQRREALVEKQNQDLEALIAKEQQELLRVAQMTREQAIEAFMERLRGETRQEAAVLIEKIQEETKERADELAQRIIGSAIQRCAVSYVSDTVTSVIDLPSDDMKGRIIGREGRNIRAIEKATGVDVIVDDTPGVIVVSCFDNVRREVARRSLERLIGDGRIHPSRIEEIVETTRKEIDEDIRQTGRQVLRDLEIPKVHAQVSFLVGRLKYRTSYGQNVLKHSIEVAHLMAAMAAELKLDPRIAKRCGILHDIGKAMTHEMDGSHAVIGADQARRCDESRVVCNAIGAHHEDMPFESTYAVLTQVGDAISASRPGARRDTIERYIERLEKLEEVASAFEGVKGAYAIQAGREVRVLVDSETVDDAAAVLIARNIAKKIEDELTYPGEVKVTLIRETRVVEVAH
ncbi:MAG: ribonuclease Y [Planctomycetota bacterium]